MWRRRRVNTVHFIWPQVFSHTIFPHMKDTHSFSTEGNTKPGLANASNQKLTMSGWEVVISIRFYVHPHNPLSSKLQIKLGTMDPATWWWNRKRITNIKNSLSENTILEGHSSHWSIIIFIHCWAKIMRIVGEGSLVGRGRFCSLGKSPCLLLFWPAIFHDDPKGDIREFHLSGVSQLSEPTFRLWVWGLRVALGVKWLVLSRFRTTVGYKIL